MNKRIFVLPVLLCFLFFGSTLFAQKSGHQIELKIANFEGDQAYFSVHYDGKQYIKDTMNLNDKGTFVMEGEKSMPGGVYLVILPPKNNYFELLLSEGDQHFTVETDAKNAVSAMKVKGSKENQLLYDYLNFLSAQRSKADPLTAEEEKATGAKKEKLGKQLDAIDQEVKQYQEKLIAENPGTLCAAQIKSTLDPPIPEPKEKLDKDALGKYQYQYIKDHFFDNIDLNDERLVRSQILKPRIEHYLDKMTYQIPDSLMKEVDFLLEESQETEEMFKYLLVHCVNKYARSKVVGMDAVYVHIVDKYYATGKAPWTEEEQLKKMIKNAKDLKPLLIGKKSPNIKIKTIDGKPIELHDIESEYTVLYFWDPECGHCTKAVPDMKEFYKEYKNKGVTMFSVCTKDKNKEECVKSIEEKEIGGWLNTMATENHELYYRLHYAIKSTPVTYILDKDKVILSKNIGASQMKDVMEMLIKLDKKDKK